MSTPIDSQLTAQGVLIPLQAVQEWLDRGLEIVKDRDQITIRPRPQPEPERDRVLQVLEQAGLLSPSEPLPAGFKPLSTEEKQALARKLGAGRPLSEIIIEDRAGRI